MEKISSPVRSPSQKPREEIKSDGPIVEEECILLTKEGAETLKSISREYNAIEFRVDMFLHKLWSVWCKKNYTPNKLIKWYLGEEVPEGMCESNDILLEHLDYYKDCISRAMGVMRTISDIPIIYTVRSTQDGGYVDTHKGTDFKLYNELVLYGVQQVKSDIVDIEFQYENNIQGIKDIISNSTNNLILMSKHYTHHEDLFDHQQLAFSLKVYEKSFDILKIVSSFESLDDFHVANKVFKEEEFDQPKIHINLGEKFKITRVMNKYLLPVWCPEISKQSTAPGQMSKQEVVEVRDKLGFESHKKRNFYLIGSPITYSPSPTFHNKVFELLGMPDHYKKLDTNNLDCAVYMIEKEDTIGCSVTIPLKKDLYLKYQDYASPDAEYIQAINTIVKIGGEIKVYNTDWMAIHKLISRKLHHVKDRQRRVLIIGAGGTSLAAIYAVLKMDWIPIVFNRKAHVDSNVRFMRKLWEHNKIPQYCHDLSLFNKINDFEEFDHLVEGDQLEGLDKLTEDLLQSDQVGKGVDAIISCIPGVAGFSIPEDVTDVLLDTNRNVIVYDASYIPKETELLKQAKDKNCQIVKGVEMLIEQAWEQAKIFTGKLIHEHDIKDQVEKAVYDYYDSIDV